MTQLSDLLARVEAAEGANRELDALICVALDQRPEWLQRAAGELWFAGMEGRWAQVRYRAEGMKRSTGNPSLSEAEIAPCTSSLDAALALVDRTMKPGLLDIEGSWDPPSPEVWPAWSVRWYPAGTDRDGKSWHAQVGSGRTPALALLAALLKALIASTASPAERQPQPRDEQEQGLSPSCAAESGRVTAPTEALGDAGREHDLSRVRAMLQRGALHKVLLQSIWTRLRDTSFDKDDARLLASAGLMMVEHYKPTQHGRRVKREFLALRQTAEGERLAACIREAFRQANLAAPWRERDGFTAAAMREEWGHHEVHRIGGRAGLSSGVRRTVWVPGTRRDDVKAALAKAFETWRQTAVDREAA